MGRLLLRSVSLIAGSFFVAVLMYSCTKAIRYAIFEGVQMDIVRKTGSWEEQILHEKDTCKADSFYILLSFSSRSISCAPSYNLPLFSQANAFKSPSTTHNLERVKDLKFYTVNNFNANYPAGREITDLVTLAMKPGNDTSQNFLSIRKFVDAYNATLEETEYDITSVTGGRIRFSEMPDIPAYHSFIIEVITTGETLLTDTTVGVYITH